MSTNNQKVFFHCVHPRIGRFKTKACLYLWFWPRPYQAPERVCCCPTDPCLQGSSVSLVAGMHPVVSWWLYSQLGHCLPKLHPPKKDFVFWTDLNLLKAMWTDFSITSPPCQDWVGFRALATGLVATWSQSHRFRVDLFREGSQAHFGDNLEKVNNSFKKEDIWYIYIYIWYIYILTILVALVIGIYCQINLLLMYCNQDFNRLHSECEFLLGCGAHNIEYEWSSTNR